MDIKKKGNIVSAEKVDIAAKQSVDERVKCTKTITNALLFYKTCHN
jgi:hypothetical protein